MKPIEILGEYNLLLSEFIGACKSIFITNLVGVYLHGSAVMGCFRPEKSDIDLLVVVKKAPADSEKRAFMDRVVELNRNAPPKGLEISVMQERVCNPFLYPTPFELHFSPAHLQWYHTDPDGYVKGMRGEDPDLAAHVTILRHRGITLWGKEIGEVFGPVPHEAYLDSIMEDVSEAQEGILKDSMYITLNLCRVLGYLCDWKILSKKDGGEWALANLPEVWHPVIRDALAEYAGGPAMTASEEERVTFAKYMLDEIEKEKL